MFVWPELKAQHLRSTNNRFTTCSMHLKSAQMTRQNGNTPKSPTLYNAGNPPLARCAYKQTCNYSTRYLPGRCCLSAGVLQQLLDAGCTHRQNIAWQYHNAKSTRALSKTSTPPFRHAAWANLNARTNPFVGIGRQACSLVQDLALFQPKQETLTHLWKPACPNRFYPFDPYTQGNYRALLRPKKAPSRDYQHPATTASTAKSVSALL